MVSCRISLRRCKITTRERSDSLWIVGNLFIIIIYYCDDFFFTKIENAQTVWIWQIVRNLVCKFKIRSWNLVKRSAGIDNALWTFTICTSSFQNLWTLEIIHTTNHDATFLSKSSIYKIHLTNGVIHSRGCSRFQV